MFIEKTVSAIMLTLLLTSMLALAINIQPVETELSPLTVPEESATMRETINLASQDPPSTEWNRTYGNSGWDEAWDAIQTSDGGYLVVGTWHSFPGWHIIKTEANGDILWTKRHGSSSYDCPRSVHQTSDGGYIIGGVTNGRFALLKIDSDGFTTWSKTYGEPGNIQPHVPYSTQPTSDGGYVLAGYTTHYTAGQRDFWVVKADENGNHQWNKTYGTSGDEIAFSIKQTTDGGYIITGFTTSLGSPDLYLVKTDENGNQLWHKAYGGPSTDYGCSVHQTVDGGYFIAGFTNSYGAGGYDFWLVRTDSSGIRQWHKTYGGTLHDSARSAVLTPDGGITIAGETESGGGIYDFWLVSTDAGGNEKWNSTYGGYSQEWVGSIRQTTDGGYLVTGYTASFGAGSYDFWLVKLASAIPQTDDLSIVEIKPIQAILDAEALVANKSTAIRVTVENTFPTRVWAEINVTYDFGTKSYLEDGPGHLGIPIDPGVNRVYIPGGPVKPTARPDPWIPAGQPPWLFWTSVGLDSNIKAVVDPLNKIPETNEANNDAVAGMEFVESESLRIRVVPIYLPIFQEPFSPDLDSARDILLATYPIADDKLTWSEASLRQIVLPSELFESPEIFTAALYPLIVRQIANEEKKLGYDRIVIVYKPPSWLEGYLPDGFSFASIGVREPVVITYPPVDETTVAHEIGHTYCLWHPHDWGMGPPVYGATQFWVNKRDYERPGNTFMSYTYKLPPDVPVYPRWIDKGRYDTDPKERTIFPWLWRWNLFDQLTVNPHPLAASTDVIMLQGLIFRNGTILDEPWYRMLGRAPDISPGTSGNFSIVCLDSDRQVLSQMGFNASFTMLVDDSNGSSVEMDIDFVPLDFNIPYVAGTKFIEIRNQTEHILYERIISANAPIVTVSYPNGGEVWSAGANYTITWEAYDLDDDPLLYSIAYSPDGGENWISLASEITPNSFLWDTHDLTSGVDYLVKVIATDGVNTGEDLSNGTFTILDLAPPSIDVTSPQNKTYFNNLVPLTFKTDEQTSWIGYSVDNQANVTLNTNTIINVEDGVHQIILYANDTSGNMGSSETVCFNVDSSFHDPWKSSFIGSGGYPIVDFATLDGKLYAAADNTLYVYDGYSWNIINTPTFVVSLEPYQDKLVVGGQGGLYSFDGATFNLVFTVPTYIKVLGVYNNTLYAGTILDKPPTIYYCSGSADNPADWYVDTDFSAVLSFSGAFGSIDSFGVYDGKMYVSSGNTVYSFDGTSWDVALSYEYAYAFLDMQVYNGKLYLATRDQNRIPMYLGGTGFSGAVIEFDGENWTTVLGHDYWIYSLEEYDGKLYVGTANRIYTFNGTFWDVSFYSAEGAYYAISMINYDGKIYAGMGNGYIFADPAPLKVEHETIVVPEFPSTTILAVFTALTMLAAALTRKKRTKRFC